jgi:hypothetical protein
MQDLSVASRGVKDFRVARDYEGGFGAPKMELVLSYRKKLCIAKRYGPTILTKPSCIIVLQVHPVVRLRTHANHGVMFRSLDLLTLIEVKPHRFCAWLVPGNLHVAGDSVGTILS